MILYFSGSGNSEYVAKYLADKLDDEVISLAPYLKENRTLDITSTKPYILVTPVYISVIPLPIEDLLSNSKLIGNNKFYFILTCAGSGVSASYVSANRICKKLNMIFMGLIHYTMPQDYLMYFQTLTKEENEKIFSSAIKKIPVAIDYIRKEEYLECKKPGLMHKLMSRRCMIVLFMKMLNKTKKFNVSENCISCSKCVNVCPTNTIKLVDGKPVWTNKRCLHCTACINRCPKEAINFGKKTTNKPRYVAIKYKEN